MPYSVFFSLPLARRQHEQAVFTSRKRKSPDDESELEQYDSEEEETPHPSSRDVSIQQPILSGGYAQKYQLLPRDIGDQYRLAGLDLEDDVPQLPFPHAPTSYGKEKEKSTAKDTKEILQALDPPLYMSEPSSHGMTLRSQHFAVINTIAHRCLLEGDYARASRAWGMILRDEFDGTAVDVRKEGTWGIGAEILLNQSTQIEQNLKDMAPSERIRRVQPWFTRHGFIKAKAYYERLILEHQFDNRDPKAISALDFYPALYGLWVCIVQAESRAAREAVEQDSSQEETSTASASQKEITRDKELKEAYQIAHHLDNVMASPPYSDSGALLRLRGMIALWIGDLHSPLVQLDQDSDTMNLDENFYEEDDMEEDREWGDKANVRQTLKEGKLKRQQAIGLAKGFLSNAKARGENIPPAIESLWEMDDAESIDYNQAQGESEEDLLSAAELGSVQKKERRQPDEGTGLHQDNYMGSRQDEELDGSNDSD